MTFQEYLNQEEPKKLYPGSVKLKEKNCFRISNHYGIKIIELKIFDKFIEYRANENGLLFTMDEDGNKKSASVFSLIDNV